MEFLMTFSYILKVTCRKGAIDFVREILNQPNVYRFVKHADKIVYDVTNIIPETTGLKGRPSCLEGINDDIISEEPNLAWKILQIESIN